jgi:abequosyltransferase
MNDAGQSSATPLLTIAIPTYNRAKFLRGSLATLLDQLVDEPAIELIVSDNASTDETPDFIKEFQDRGLNLRYIRNQSNIGLDANFLQCFNESHGKYLWLLGDDDIVVPGALRKLLALLAAADYSLVYLSLYEFHNDYIAERKNDKFNRFAQHIPNGLPFIEKVGTQITFMSSMIVNRDTYNSVPRPPLQNLIGSNLMHLGWLLPVLGCGGTSLIVWDKLLAGRHSYAGGWGICRTFGDNLTDLLRTSLPGREDIAAAVINPTLRNWFPTMIMQTRWSPPGPLGRENFRKSLEPLFKTNWRYWVFVFPVAVLPYWLARIWFLVTQQMNRAGRVLMTALIYPHSRRHFISETK